MNQSRPQVVISSDPSHIGDAATPADVAELAAAVALAIPHADVYVRPIGTSFTAPIRMRPQVQRVYAKLFSI